MKKRVLNVDLIYPIGFPIETLDKDFDPNTYFGGKWELEVDGTVLVSKTNITDDIFNATAGTIIGSNTHKHKVWTRPWSGTAAFVSGVQRILYDYNTENDSNTYSMYFGDTESDAENLDSSVQKSKIIYRWWRVG